MDCTLTLTTYQCLTLMSKIIKFMNAIPRRAQREDANAKLRYVTRYLFPSTKTTGCLSLTACSSQRKTQGDIGNGAQCHVAESNTTDDTIPQKAVAPIKQRYSLATKNIYTPKQFIFHRSFVSPYRVIHRVTHPN